MKYLLCKLLQQIQKLGPAYLCNYSFNCFIKRKVNLNPFAVVRISRLPTAVTLAFLKVFLEKKNQVLNLQKFVVLINRFFLNKCK